MPHVRMDPVHYFYFTPLYPDMATGLFRQYVTSKLKKGLQSFLYKYV